MRLEWLTDTRLETLRRLCGYAALIVLAALALALYLLLPSIFDDYIVGWGVQALIHVSMFPMLFVLLGVVITTINQQNGLLAARLSVVGFLLVILGTVSGTISSRFLFMGAATMEVGLVQIAISIPASRTKLRMAIWGLFLANLVFYVSGYINPDVFMYAETLAEKLMLLIVVILEGGATVLIGVELLRRESGGKQPEAD